MTQQRQVILEVLRGLDTHPTADELYRLVRRRLPRISLGTVYRNLQVLADWGMINAIAVSGTQKRFDGKIDDHCHVRCVKCGRIEDTPVGGLGPLDEAARRVSAFEILGHRLEFVGICPGCQAKSHLGQEEGA